MRWRCHRNFIPVRSSAPVIKTGVEFRINSKIPIPKYFPIVVYVRAEWVISSIVTAAGTGDGAGRNIYKRVYTSFMTSRFARRAGTREFEDGTYYARQRCVVKKVKRESRDISFHDSRGYSDISLTREFLSLSLLPFGTNIAEGKESQPIAVAEKEFRL